MSKIEFIDLKRQYASLRDPINARIQAVLDHGQYIMGPEVRELELRLATYVDASECITVSSGTEALLIALMALNIGPGDEVITSPFTFAATAEMIALIGATPVFVDVEPDTCNISAAAIEVAITDRTRAIMPVSLYGQVPDVEEINKVAERHNIPVVEDAAQSFGALYKGRKSCGVTNIGCTSFFPSKPLGCYGDGGAIFTSDRKLAQIMREIRVHGQEKRYMHTRVGVGGRMDTIQCAVVLAKLDQFDWEVSERMKAGQRYLDLLSGANAITAPVVRSDRTSVWAQFTVQVSDRAAVVSALEDAGVPTAIHYPIPLHLQTAYKDRCTISGSLANSEAVASRVISLPMHPYITADVQARVIEALKRAVTS